MRTIRTKHNKKKNDEYIDRDPIRALSLLAKIAMDYLIIHKNAWNREGAYLKPYHKGSITMAINRLNDFIRIYNRVPGAMEVDAKKRVIREIVKNKMIEIDKLKMASNDTILFKSIGLAAICVEVMDKEVKRLGFAFLKQQMEISKAVRAFDTYKGFWIKEVGELAVNYDD